MKIRTAFALFAVGSLLLSTPGIGQIQQPYQPVLRPYTLPPVDRGIVTRPRAERMQLAEDQGSVVSFGRTRETRSAYAPGRVIVKFRPFAAAARAVREASRTGTLLPRQRSANFDEVRLETSEDAAAVARALNARSDVEYAQAAYRVHPRFVPNDTYYSMLQWNFPAIDLERGWDIQRGATSSVVVAVIDTGMAFRSASMQYFASAFSRNGIAYPSLGLITVPFTRGVDLAASGTAGDSRFVAPRDFIWDNANPFDLDEVGHGTHVSGTIGELTDNSLGVAGIAFNAKLMPLKVVSGVWDEIFGAPNEGTDATVAAAIRYAADNGAKVINMSIGRTGEARSAQVVEDAMSYAVGKGCFIAVAGGNGGLDGHPLEVYAEIASRLDGVVAVSATDRNHQRPSYSTISSYNEVAAPGGSNADFVYQESYDPALVETYLLPPSQYRAPRFDTTVLLGISGTSMSTPHVSGVAALLMEQGITKPAAIEAALRKYATDLGAPGRDQSFGFGEINARATLRGLGLAR